MSTENSNLRSSATSLADSDVPNVTKGVDKSISNVALLRNIERLKAAGWQKATLTLGKGDGSAWQIMWRNPQKTAAYILPEAIKQLETGEGK
ncbi:MAG: hypothetical protein IT367_18090 [Candidatus Hydrogenedentes bacterium]|nr:hypothetical protein [Candidatus Hydrogenedentota bacterium]